MTGDSHVWWGPYSQPGSDRCRRESRRRRRDGRVTQHVDGRRSSSSYSVLQETIKGSPYDRFRSRSRRGDRVRRNPAVRGRRRHLERRVGATLRGPKAVTQRSLRGALDDPESAHRDQRGLRRVRRIRVRRYRRHRTTSDCSRNGVPRRSMNSLWPIGGT